MIASALRRPVLWETVVLALLCVIDTFSTVVLLKMGLAIEANPLLQPFVRQGLAVFVFAKSALFVSPLAILEGLRALRPQFVQVCLRAGIVGYVLVYVVGSLGVHGHL
jgi:hypothetical protein